MTLPDKIKKAISDSCSISELQKDAICKDVMKIVVEPLILSYDLLETLNWSELNSKQRMAYIKLKQYLSDNQ
jgi:hypothetical protein